MEFARIARASALAACVAAPALASAQSSVPNNTVDIGAIFFDVHSQATDIAGPFTPPGLNLTVGNATTFYLAYIRRLSDHVDFDIEGGVPPTQDVTAVGPGYLGSVPYNGEKLGTAKAFTPAAFIDYRFMDEHSPFQPYAGVGLNYTHFYDISSTTANNAVNGGYTQLGLADSWGLAGHVGFRYRFTPMFSFNVGVTLADVRSTLSITTNGNLRSSEINFRPVTYTAALGVSF